MVVSTQVFKSTYVADGVDTAFDIGFPFNDDPDRIQVFLDDVLQTSGYVVDDAGANWIVSFTVAPGVGVVVAIVRSTPITQDMIYTPNEDFPAESHEAALDKLTMIAQELAGAEDEGGGGSGIEDGSYGDINVSGSGTILTISDNAVSLAKMADVAGPSFLGRSSGTGDPQAMSPTTATSILNAFTSIAKGLAPASGGGSSNFLRADGTWAAPTLATVWGQITGTLADQTDLQTALNTKANTTHTHVANDISNASTAGKNMLTAADAAAQTALLDNFTSALKGLAPASGGGTANFLRADGTWAAPVGGGGGLVDGNYGDITISGTGTVITINADAVTSAKMADMAASTVKGALVAGNPIDLTTLELTTLVEIFTSSLKGVVPGSGGGTVNFLRADGTWTAPTASAAWGSITGTLSAQTDLQTALNAKQPLDTTLTSIAALGTAANKMIYTTALDTWAESNITAAGRALIDDADAPAQRNTLGIGQSFMLRSVGGTATAITASTGASLTELLEHMMFRMKPGSNSTGSTTIAIDGLAAVPLRSPTGTALAADDIHTGFYYDMVAIGSPVTEIRICRF